MEIDVSSRGDVTVVRLSGRIVDGQPAAAVQAALQKLVREKKLDTIIDLEAVSWFDSVAIGLLIGHYVSVSSRGGKIVLFRANEKVRSLLELVRLDDRFGWADDIDTALARFQST